MFQRRSREKRTTRKERKKKGRRPLKKVLGFFFLVLHRELQFCAHRQPNLSNKGGDGIQTKLPDLRKLTDSFDLEWKRGPAAWNFHQ